MTIIIFCVILIVTNLIMFKIGIKTEQRARSRRLKAIKKLLNG